MDKKRIAEAKHTIDAESASSNKPRAVSALFLWTPRITRIYTEFNCQLIEQIKHVFLHGSRVSARSFFINWLHWFSLWYARYVETWTRPAGYLLNPCNLLIIEPPRITRIYTEFNCQLIKLIKHVCLHGLRVSARSFFINWLISSWYSWYAET